MEAEAQVVTRVAAVSTMWGNQVLGQEQGPQAVVRVTRPPEIAAIQTLSTGHRFCCLFWAGRVVAVPVSATGQDGLAAEAGEVEPFS